MQNPYPVDGPTKPAFGSPCTGCGLCCVATPCEIALKLIPAAVEDEPCPALEWRDGRSWCGLARDPALHSQPAALLMFDMAGGDLARLAELNAKCGADVLDALGIGQGFGCDSGPNPMWRDQTDREIGQTAHDYFEEHYVDA